MSRKFKLASSALTGLTLNLLLVSGAMADPIVDQTTIITDAGGQFSVEKQVRVFNDASGGDPFPVDGLYTYLYTLTALSGDPICGFNVSVPDNPNVEGAGFVGIGVAPQSVTIKPLFVEFLLADAANPFNCIVAGAPGMDATADLYITSSFGPGGVADTITVSLNSFSGFDENGTCVGPIQPPALACELEIVKEGCVVQPPDPPGDACEGKVKAFDFVYTGLGCAASSHLQDPKKAKCIGGATGNQPVDIIVSGKKHKRHWDWWGWWKKSKKKKVFASFTNVNVGDTITVDASLAGKKGIGSNTTIKIKTGGSWHDIIELDKFHTSCSQPLAPGNQFGSIQITSLTSSKGGTVALPEDDPFEDCVTDIDVVPAPHCLGKVTTLLMRYVGGDCGGTMHEQGAGKVSCFDASPAGTDDVRIIVSDGASAPPATNVYTDTSPVGIGGIIEISATQLKSTTGFWIKRASDNTLIQDGFFHTSCSQPLNLGDQIGGLQVFGLTTTNGGTIALGQDVDYTYVVTNPNADEAVNVSVNDDLLGNIASGQILAAGASATFTTTALVEATTTNIATVTGDVLGVQCDPTQANATITVAQPPPASQTCTSKIQAMLLRYDGPSIAGPVTVVLVPKNSPSVTYNLASLNNGDVLSKASEGGFTVNGQPEENDLGSKVKIFINGVEEELHTSCSTPFVAGAPAPLNNPKGAPSANWFVVDFTQKN